MPNAVTSQEIIERTQPEILAQIDLGKQKQFPRTNGKLEWRVWFTCKECEKSMWIRRASIYRKVTPNCRKCNARVARDGIVRKITPNMIPKELRQYFDFSKQERRPIGNDGATTLFIWSICGKCKEGRWIPHIVARTKKTPYCLSCKNKHTFRGKSKGEGFFISKGYKIVDITRYYPEHVEYIQEHLIQHGGSKATPIWFKEHRVVALIHYGPDAVKSGNVIRHIDGDKLNNDPSNLIPGTPKQNRMDHKQALMLMDRYRQLSLTLIKMLLVKNL